MHTGLDHRLTEALSAKAHLDRAKNVLVGNIQAINVFSVQEDEMEGARAHPTVLPKE
jgi:hypothetical protein